MFRVRTFVWFLSRVATCYAKSGSAPDFPHVRIDPWNLSQVEAQATKEDVLQVMQRGESVRNKV